MFSEHEVVLSQDVGLYIRYGRYAGSYKNFCYLIQNKETNEKYYKMTCNEDNTIYTTLSIDDVKLILNYLKIINHIDPLGLFKVMDMLMQKTQSQKKK